MRLLFGFSIVFWCAFGITPAQAQDFLLKTLTGHSAPVTSVAFSPDGTKALSGSEDETVKLWDLRTGTAIRTFSGHSGIVTSVAFSPDGNQVLSASEGTRIWLWDLRTGKKIHRLIGQDSELFHSVTFTPDGTKALSGSYTVGMKLWDLRTGKLLRIFERDEGTLNYFFLKGQSNRVMSLTNYGSARVWDLSSGKLHQTLKKEGENEIAAAVFSPDGKFFLTGSELGWGLTGLLDSKIFDLWYTAQGKNLNTFNGHRGEVTALAFSPDGKKILSGSRDKLIGVWEMNGFGLIRTFAGHSDYINGLAVSSDGKLALSASRDKTIKLWNLQ